MSKRSSILLAAAFVMTIALVGCGSNSTTTTGVDTVAPAAILDLEGNVVTIPGLGVDLSWAPSTEPDVVAYYVYRSSVGTGSVRVGVQTTPSFHDGSVAWGVVYAYEVSAVDESQNESPRVTTIVATPNPAVPAGAGGARQHMSD